VNLTPKGKKRTKEIADCFNEIDSKLFDGISKRDRELFEKILHELTVNLQSQPSTNLFFNYKKIRK
jgi:DNA-binding MarR family transcriptional regulator